MDALTANHVFKKPELALFGADLARARQAPLDGRQTTVLTPCPRTTGVPMHQILQDKSLFRPHCLINGQWRDAADKGVLDVVNPANGKLPTGGNARTCVTHSLNGPDSRQRGPPWA